MFCLYVVHPSIYTLFLILLRVSSLNINWVLHLEPSLDLTHISKSILFCNENVENFNYIFTHFKNRLKKLQPKFFWVGLGRNLNLWYGSCPLKDLFPELFRIAVDKEASMEFYQFYLVNGYHWNMWSWYPQFNWSFQDLEIEFMENLFTFRLVRENTIYHWFDLNMVFWWLVHTVIFCEAST